MKEKPSTVLYAGSTQSWAAPQFFTDIWLTRRPLLCWLDDDDPKTAPPTLCSLGPPASSLVVRTRPCFADSEILQCGAGAQCAAHLWNS